MIKRVLVECLVIAVIALALCGAVLAVSAHYRPHADLWAGSDSTLSLYVTKGGHSAQFVIYPYFMNASTIGKLDSLLDGGRLMVLEYHAAKEER